MSKKRKSAPKIVEFRKEDAQKLAELFNSFDREGLWPGGFTGGIPYTAEMTPRADGYGRFTIQAGAAGVGETTGPVLAKADHELIVPASLCAPFAENFVPCISIRLNKEPEFDCQRLILPSPHCR